MAKRNYKKRTGEEIKQEVESLCNQAVQEIEKYTKKPEDVLELMDFMGQFYQYSLYNQMLIQRQFEGASAVGSFNFFKSKGFSVRKGEKGIRILKPSIYKFFEDEKGEWKPISDATQEEKQQIEQKQLKVFERTRFSPTAVFDISQTNAKPEDYPKLFPNRVRNFKAEDKEVALLLKKALYEFAKQNNIDVKEELIQAVAGGYYRRDTHNIVLNSRNTEYQKIATLIHELGHATMHNEEAVAKKDEKLLDTPTKEFQAEMVSYIVSKQYGIDTSEKAIPYIAIWTNNGQSMKDKEEALKEVHKEASSFISFIDKEIEKGMKELAAEKEDDKLREVFKQVGVQENGFLEEPVIVIREAEVHEKVFFRKGDVLPLSDMDKQTAAYNREIAQKQHEAEKNGDYYPYTKVFYDMYLKPNERLEGSRYDLDGESEMFSKHLRLEMPRKDLIGVLERMNSKQQDNYVQKDQGMEM